MEWKKQTNRTSRFVFRLQKWANDDVIPNVPDFLDWIRCLIVAARQSTAINCWPILKAAAPARHSVANMHADNYTYSSDCLSVSLSVCLCDKEVHVITL